MKPPITLRPLMEEKPASTLAKTDAMRNFRQIKNERAAQGLMRRERKGKMLLFHPSGRALQTSPAAVRAFLIICNDVVDGGMTLQKLLARGQTKHAKFVDWKAPPNLADERQRQYRVAQKTGLENENILPTGRHSIYSRMASSISITGMSSLIGYMR